LNMMRKQKASQQWACKSAVCGKLFASSDARDQHMEDTGHGDWCGQCGREFNSMQSLWQHQQDTGHGDDDSFVPYLGKRTYGWY